jgi:hypothetical protein
MFFILPYIFAKSRPEAFRRRALRRGKKPAGNGSDFRGKMAEKCMRFCGAVLLGLVILQLSPSHGSSGGSNSLASGGASADTDSSGGGDGDGSSDASSRRRAQVDVPDPPVCAQSLERGEGSMLCGTSAGRELCTSACLIVDSLQPVPPPPVPPPDPVLGVAVCDQVLARGFCSSFLDACPDVCTASGSAADPTQGGNRVDGMSCLVLLQLEGGCAHATCRSRTRRSSPAPASATSAQMPAAAMASAPHRPWMYLS